MAFAVLMLAQIISAEGIGGQGGAVWRAPLGAESFAMGGAHTADPQYNRVWWNPAALAIIRRGGTISVGGGYRPLGRSEMNFGLEKALPPILAGGLLFAYRGDHSLDNLRGAEGEQLPKSSFTALDLSAGLSISISRRFSAGASIEYLYEKIPSGYDPQSLAITYSKSSPNVGFSAGLVEKVSERYQIGLTVKHLNSRPTMSPDATSNGGMNAELEDDMPAPVTIAQRVKTTIASKPFFWTTDISLSMFKADFSQIDHFDGMVNNGFEWQLADAFALRAGLRELHFNRYLVKEYDQYAESFRPVLSFGCGLKPVNIKMKKATRSLAINYGISNSRIAHGVDQQFDVVFFF